ncbi:MAG: hypothetical protein U5L11_07670 [Arhodomonas sp.]|nr:hypothetical protein [Arhodomonas sp.]
MLELLWLLLPVAALSGWAVGRRERGDSGAQRPASFSPEYFRGLNYLLNEQPDKAIEVFTQMVEVDSDTVETHLALGNLFRRRGEVDRAIRIHQNLIARPSLERGQRSYAMLELAEGLHERRAARSRRGDLRRGGRAAGSRRHRPALPARYLPAGARTGTSGAGRSAAVPGDRPGPAAVTAPSSAASRRRRPCVAARAMNRYGLCSSGP